MTEPTLTLAEISAHLDGLLAKARIATDAPAPPWALDLLIGVARYEDQHGLPADGWGCLADVLAQVPAEVRGHAERVAQHRAEGGDPT
ncbi:hypothetical protein ACIBSV_46980 [Embleya sp. NPDC050154]|uniref:hypothetical protein n=1 Tax=Embleya sp. NPDC050154 TaxID=3363988 RepID=UPI00379A75E2